MALGSAYASIGSAQQAPLTAFAGPGGFFLSPASTPSANGGGGTTASKSRQQHHHQQQRQSCWHSSSSSSGCSVGAVNRRARALGTLNMSEEAGSGGSDEMPEATKRLLAQAAKIRAEAEEMEIAYRKEQGVEDFVPTGAKVSSIGDASTAAAAAPVAVDPSNAVALAAAAAGSAVKSTPESRAALVVQLEDLPPDSKQVIEKMRDLKTGGLAPRWESFNFGTRYPISQGQLKMQTGLDGKSLAADGGDMDDLKYALGAVCLFSFAAAIGSGAAIGGNVGASFTYFFALLPIVFLAIGSTAPGIITAVINNVRRKSQDDFEERRVRHEASHFLSGYLCGLPIKSYRADGGTTLVEFYDSAEGDMAGRALKFTADEVDMVSIVAMSGAVGEAQAFGTATGGALDLDNLGQIMNQTSPPMGGKEQQSQARWATLMAHRLLTSHEPELNSVMAAFREGKPVSECVAALEGARS